MYYDTTEFINKTKSFNSCFSFFHLNVASLSLHFDSLETFFDQISYKFSIIGISETRFSKFMSPSERFSLPGYSQEHTPTESSAGGTLLYISDLLTYQCRNDLSDILYKSRELESTFVEISFKSSKSFIVGCIYRHPCMPISDFNELFLTAFLNQISKENKILILLGDFNIDLLKTGNNGVEDDFLDILGSFPCIPQISLPTRVTDRSSTLIDNIFISPTSFNLLSGNLTFSLSDHMPQILLLQDFIFNSNVKSSKIARNWKQFDRENFILDYFSIDWGILDGPDLNIDDIFNNFFNQLTVLLDKYAPTIKTSKSKTRLKSKPWITRGYCNFYS